MGKTDKAGSARETAARETNAGGPSEPQGSGGGGPGPHGGGGGSTSLAQVAGSAVAAVVAAMLAGKLGVYGTFLGAGVMSVIATTGGPLFQHLFHRTGRQIKQKTVQVQPRVRQVAVRERRVGLQKAGVLTLQRPGGGGPAGDAVEAAACEVPGPGGDRAPGEDGGEEYTAATTHGTRWRGWRRALLPATLVFALAVGGVTLYEVIAGHSVSGGKGTSLSRVLSPGDDSGAGTTSTPSGTRGPTPSASQGTGNGSADPSHVPGIVDHPAPGTATGEGHRPQGSAAPTGEPSTAPSSPGASAPDPGHSGTAGDGSAGGDTATGDGGSGSADGGGDQQFAPRQVDPGAGGG